VQQHPLGFRENADIEAVAAHRCELVSGRKKGNRGLLTFRTSPWSNRLRHASGIDGTASLANGDFGRGLPTNRRKMVSPV
jgi:hypothetical protein